MGGILRQQPRALVESMQCCNVVYNCITGVMCVVGIGMYSFVTCHNQNLFESRWQRLPYWRPSRVMKLSATHDLRIGTVWAVWRKSKRSALPLGTSKSKSFWFRCCFLYDEGDVFLLHVCFRNEMKGQKRSDNKHTWNARDKHFCCTDLWWRSCQFYAYQEGVC